MFCWLMNKRGAIMKPTVFTASLVRSVREIISTFHWHRLFHYRERTQTRTSTQHFKTSEAVCCFQCLLLWKDDHHKAGPETQQAYHSRTLSNTPLLDQKSSRTKIYTIFCWFLRLLQCLCTNIGALMQRHRVVSPWVTSRVKRKLNSAL